MNQYFSDEQLRLVANLSQHYEAWCQSKRALAGLTYRLQWERRGDREYLYRRQGNAGSGTSLGPRSSKTEQAFADHTARRAEANLRLTESQATVEQTARQYVALRLPLIASPAAAILRAADIDEMLGSMLIVVGTNAFAAYELEAASRFLAGLDATEDFDLAFTGGQSSFTLGGGMKAPASLFGLLRRLDESYTVNTERTFQALNRKGYAVELLAAPSVISRLPKDERLIPIALPEQEWLLAGTRVNHVVCARDGSPARIIAPDPRWMALHKLWLGAQGKRDPLKREKDLRQGALLLAMVAEAMPQFPLDDGFERELPEELARIFATQRPQLPTPRQSRW